MKKIGMEIRVRYVETDQMGAAHHASYFAWMEAARTELLRKNGMSYRAFEEKGFHLPVREAYCRYRKSLLFCSTVHSNEGPYRRQVEEIFHRILP